MTGRRPVGILLGAAGLTVVASASTHPPMAGRPPAVDDPAAALTPTLAVDYCAGDQPIGPALDLFFLLNAVGLVTFRRLVGRGAGPS